MQVLDAAEQFDDARELLQRQPPGSGVLLPLLNAAAVAVELFLKSLSTESIFVPQSDFDGYKVYAQPELKHHRLHELFDNIPDDIRIELEARFATAGITTSATSLRDLLMTYENLFMASRYPFEAELDIRNYPLAQLMELSTFLRTVIAKMKPVDKIEW